MKVYLKDGTEAETYLDPMLVAHLAHAWRRCHIVVAIQVAQGERNYFINLMNVDIDRSLRESGAVVTQAMYP